MSENYEKSIAKLKMFTTDDIKMMKEQQSGNEVKLSMSLMFFPHFYFICDFLLYRHMVTWNLFVSYNKEVNCD